MRPFHRNFIFQSDSILIAGFVCILYSYVVIPYVSMSGQSGSGRERHHGRTDYLSGYQKREKETKQEEQEKKEQTETG